MNYNLLIVFLVAIVLSVMVVPIKEPFAKIDPLDYTRDQLQKWIPIVDKGNELATQWLPNIGWWWKINDQIIDFQRARKGIPPMNRINPSNLSVSVQSKPMAFIWK